MSAITLDQLRAVMPYAGRRADSFHGPLTRAMAEFEIATPPRMAAFLAQIAHESGSLRYVRELADGTAYEGRKDLGNILPGDGQRYKGRGLIQITGRANYKQCSAALFGDGQHLQDYPEILEQPEHAARSAAWFWHSRSLNALADQGAFEKITRLINGGTNGLTDRLAYYARAQRVLQLGDAAA